MDQQIKAVVENLLGAKEKYRRNIEEIEKLLNSYNIDNKQMIVILSSLADDYIFLWLDFISNKLPSLASEEGFIELLRKIVYKVKGDMAQGPFIRALIRIGEQDDELGISLYTKMVDDEDTNLVYYSSFPLGGSGRKNFENAFALVIEGTMDSNSNKKAACLRSLRVIFENRTELKETDGIFNLLRKLSEDEDALVQIEVLDAYFDFSQFFYSECIERLKKFAEREDAVIRLRIADLLWLRNLNSKEDEIDLLQICAKDENANVLSRVAVALSEKGREFPEASLRIIKKWILRNKYYDIREIDYCLKRIGELYLDRCLLEVETWVDDREGGEKLQFFVPIVLQELSSQEYEKLLAVLEGWPLRSKRFWRVTLRTIRKILTELPAGQNTSGAIVGSCFGILIGLANGKGLKVGEIIRGESDKLYQCFKLIDALEFERKEIEYEKIAEALGKYSAINSFIGCAWLDKMKREGNTTHPLLGLLAFSILDEANFAKEIEALKEEGDNLKREVMGMQIINMISPKAFVEYLDGLLNKLASKANKLKDIKNGLRNQDQFWETVSEVEVICSFINDYKVVIAPKIEDKKLDLSVEMNGEELLIEVINPEMFKPLKYMTGKAIGIGNRAKGKIYGEFKAHLENLSILEGKHVLVVIDIGRSLIDYDFVEDYLLGTLQLTMQIDKTTGKVVREYPSRADDAMHTLEKKTDVLSAVICYKSSMGNDMKFHRTGKVMLNPHAINPLSEKTVELIQKCLFT